MKSEYKSTNDTRIAVLENTSNHIIETLNRIDRRLEKLEEKMDKGFDKINTRLWTNFYFLLSAIAGLGLLMAHGFKWF
jgi:hypothetical protein